MKKESRQGDFNEFNSLAVGARGLRRKRIEMIPALSAIDVNSAPEIQRSAASRPLRQIFAINGVEKPRSLRYACTVYQIGGLRRIFRKGRLGKSSLNRSSKDYFQFRVFVLVKESTTLLPQSFL